MTAYKVFTIVGGQVEEGVMVEKFILRGAGVAIPAVLVGQEGRGRQLGVLPVQLSREQYKEWAEKGRVRIGAAEIGQTKTGTPKLFSKDSPDTDEQIICVFRTPIGFRGSNSHTGDRVGWECPKCDARGTDLNVPDTCPKCGASGWGDAPKPIFAPFPGEILVRGIIAQGTAGRMGSGEQLVALIPKGVVFRTGYSGRLYGAPGAHYYLWDGKRLICATWEERMAADLFFS